jgi:hypothetical protein
MGLDLIISGFLAARKLFPGRRKRMPEICNIGNESIEYFANEVRRYGHIFGDLRDIVCRMRGRVEIRPDRELIFGGDLMVRKRPREFVIYVSEVGFPLRERYIIAHELGHFVLHSQCGKYEIKQGYEKRTSEGEERQADLFARALLIPADQLCLLAKNNFSLLGLSMHFCVPTGVLNQRIKDLTS